MRSLSLPRRAKPHNHQAAQRDNGQHGDGRLCRARRQEPLEHGHGIAQALKSLTRLENLAARLVLPGHGEPWTQGITDAVRQIRATTGPSGFLEPEKLG